MMEDDEAFLAHYGILRRSGRYPWGSGGNVVQNSNNFLSMFNDLKKQGLTESEIATGMGLSSTTELRAIRSIAKTEKRQADALMALRLKEKGLSNVAIGEKMGINESSVRSLLDPAMKERADILKNVAETLKSEVAKQGTLDVGRGVESHLDVSAEKLNTAVAMLKDEGYSLYYVNVDQLGTGHQTKVKVLAPPGVTYSDVYKNQDKIGSITAYSEDGGRTINTIKTPTNVDSKRVAIRYAEDGGADADGVIYVRPGVPDVALGGARYAQVRIAVDGTHYLKGMAMYKDDLPEGVDLLFNTNKTKDTPMMGSKDNTVLKGLKDDPDLPFGAVIRQMTYIDKDGKQQLSAMNIVNEEGDWGKWSRNLSSQMLSKQSPSLAKEQLDISYATKKANYDEIMSLTNPAVRKKLLESFADDMDSSAVHLKAAALPRQSTHVILPVNSLKENEIYAPNYRNGERVALVRFPHGGLFEIPELTVNNRHPGARELLSSNPADAVGINSKVAARLSGADFDGDTVLVIPNNNRRVKSSPPLEGLKGFDPQVYRIPEGSNIKKMDARTKQQQMGNVSNLITDMTIRGATQAELARAVRHSMVVIDAEKHNLNWKQSEVDNGIRALKAKYQGDGDPRAGASTLISRASAEKRVNKRIPRRASEGGPIDPETGRKVYTETGESYTNKQGKTVLRTEKTTRMAEVNDARELIKGVGTPMEHVYADHANRLKALANEARKSILATESTPWSSSAKTAYADEVASLNAKLNLAKQNAPKERKAQLIANAIVKTKTQANPEMDAADKKKIKGQALTEARIRTGASKDLITFTPREWEAIQNGAISNSKLVQILNNADLDAVRKLATPRQNTVMNAPTLARAKSMLAAGYSQSEIADALGIATSTLNDALVREES